MTETSPDFIEIFRDENAGNLIYIAENGAIAAVPAGTLTAPVPKVKNPVFTHGLDFTVRKAGGHPLEYVVIKMDNMLVSSVQFSTDDASPLLLEHVTLNFSKFELTYTPQDDKGGKRRPGHRRPQPPEPRRYAGSGRRMAHVRI